MSRHRGFTLIELLVVIAIIATLVAILLPAVQQAREAARRSTCKNNLKQFGIALHNYHDTHKVFPAAIIFDTSKSDWWNYTGVSWGAHILPYIEQPALYDRINFNVQKPATDASNASVRTSDIPIFRCPTDPGTRPVSDRGPTSYVVCTGNNNSQTVWGGGGTSQNNGNTVMYGNSSTNFANITDGTSNTMVISECLIGVKYVETQTYDYANIPFCLENTPTATYNNRRGTSWFTMYADRGPTFAYTTQVPPNGLWDVGSCTRSLSTYNADAQSMHKGGVQTVLGDGAVRFISENIHLPTWQNLGNMRDGQVLGEF